MTGGPPPSKINTVDQAYNALVSDADLSTSDRYAIATLLRMSDDDADYWRHRAYDCGDD